MNIYVKEFIKGFFRGAGAVIIDSLAYFSVKQLKKEISHKNH